MTKLTQDVKNALEQAYIEEDDLIEKSQLKAILENSKLAEDINTIQYYSGQGYEKKKRNL